MIHGLAASLHDWDDLLPALSAAGYAGYALDLLGHGDSLKPPRLGEYTIENVYAHLSAWLDALSLREPSVLIGHSLGGYLAMQYALRFPECVRGLVLVNPFYSLRQLPLSLQLFFSRPLVNTVLIARTPYWLFRALVDLSSLSLGGNGAGTHLLPEKVRIQTALDYKRAAPEIFNIPRTIAELTPDLPRLTQPTLVLWGERDQTLAPDSFPRLMQLLPNAGGEAIPVCGHVPHQCHSGRFNRLVLDFLASL